MNKEDQSITVIITTSSVLARFFIKTYYTDTFTLLFHNSALERYMQEINPGERKFYWKKAEKNKKNSNKKKQEVIFIISVKIWL